MITRGYLLGISAAGAYGFMCQLSRNSGSLNILEPIGPVQACTGITLHLTLPLLFLAQAPHFYGVLISPNVYHL